MDTPVITIARALDLGVPRAWQEAAALAMEAGQASIKAGHAVSAEHCLVSGAGGLALDGAPRSGTAPVAALAGLLEDLLEGQSAPAELRTLATDGAARHGGDVEGFLEALTFFDPPDRRDAISAFARRALALAAQLEAEAELSQLRRTARTRPHAESAPESPRRTISGRTLAIAVAAVAWSLVAVIVAGWYITWPARDAAISAPGDGAPPAEGTTAAGGIVAAASAAIDRATTAGLRAIGLAAPERESPAPGQRPPSPATPPPAKATARPAPVPATVPPPLAMVTTAPAAPPADSPGVELPTRAAEPESATAPPPSVPVFFSSDDTDVEVPVLVYPQFPANVSRPAPADVDHFELLINETGTVERVRLLARQPRLEDRMMVSAAKAWRFQPATRAGQPVRYLLRLPTTAAPAPEPR